MISIDQLQFNYAHHKVLSIPHLEVNEQEHLLVLGTSGSGKTTLLHMMAGLLEPTHGSITVGQTNLYGLAASERDKYRGQNIGLVFQKSHLISALNVEDNLLLAQYLAGAAQDRGRIHEVLEELGLLAKKKKSVKALSQGEQQRVTIARALLNRPRLILADEPTASLDDANASKVINLLKEQAKHNGASLLIATHDQRVKDQFELQLNLSAQ